MKRRELIQQLRHALHLAQSPHENVVEFTLGDTEFSFEVPVRCKTCNCLADLNCYGECISCEESLDLSEPA